MAQPTIQTSFNSGEWAPHLYARTDLEKYHSGAALLHNFFVDYRGGASTRSGTKYCLRGFKDSTTIRLITFQASIITGYAMEFGDGYVRFYKNGSPVLEAATSITIATPGPPEVFTDTAHGYANGDWLFAQNHYYIVANKTTNTYTLTDLFGVAITTNPFTLPASAQRVYTIVSPYAAADLALLKFVQNVSVMLFTHPNYVPYVLTFISQTNWTLAAIVFGASIAAPANTRVTTTIPGAAVNYSYVITSVDGNGQESDISIAAIITAQDLRTTAGTNTITWDPVSGAASYNVYKSNISYAGPVPTGSPYGFIGNTTATSLPDSNITAYFSQPPPTAQNPFATGSKVTAVTVTAGGSYTTAPTMLFTAPPSGTRATGTPVLEVNAVTSVAAGGSGYNAADTVTLSNGVVLTVLTVTGGPPGAVATVSITSLGSTGTIPANPVAQVSSSGAGTGATFNLTWKVYSTVITQAGNGYLTAPTITYSTGSAAATATIGAASVGNPAVPAFFQQRLCLAAPLSFPETLYFSRPGTYYNYDGSTPAQDDDAITAAIVSGQLTNIKAMIPQSGGLIVFTDGISYLINGGSLGSAITPSSITSNAQSYIGANDMPPIVVNYDILSVPAKGSSVRDSTYNFYANVFTGADISVLSSQLFFGYELLEWAWNEEPFKMVWAVRNDGTMLTLTFIKEQDFIAWTHHDTEAGAAQYKSVCSVVEAASIGFQNFVYNVTARTIGGTPVQYIEYAPERATSGLAKDYWTVDCGLQYVGAPATTFSGAEFIAGKTCTGLADGVVIPPFVMPANGTFTLGTAASKVTVGLGFVCDLQTLYIDLGASQGTVQSKEKKINGVALRVTETLGLSIGSNANNPVAMKDLVVGNIGRMTNRRVTDLVTGDAFTYIDPKWQEEGQIYVRQLSPLPATILGYMPQVTVGDTK